MIVVVGLLLLVCCGSPFCVVAPFLEGGGDLFAEGLQGHVWVDDDERSTLEDLSRAHQKRVHIIGFMAANKL